MAQAKQQIEVEFLPIGMFLCLSRMQKCHICNRKQMIIAGMCNCCKKRWCLQCIDKELDIPLSFKKKVHCISLYSVKTLGEASKR